ncbi:hypothetical protein Bca4012_036310 [Brassica carinata]
MVVGTKHEALLAELAFTNSIATFSARQFVKWKANNKKRREELPDCRKTPLTILQLVRIRLNQRGRETEIVEYLDLLLLLLHSDSLLRAAFGVSSSSRRCVCVCK